MHICTLTCLAVLFTCCPATSGRSGAAADCTGRRVASGRGASSADRGSAGSVARLGLRVRRRVSLRARVRIRV